MSDFECRPGECIDCCTYDFIIPVTLPDLYRQLVYLNDVEGEKKTFAEIFHERCDGWELFSSRKGDKNYPLPIPRSRMPCPNVNYVEKICGIHDSAQYVACALSPENLLLPEHIGRDREPFESFGCIANAKLSPKTEARTRKVKILLQTEIKNTGILLNPPDKPLITEFGQEALRQIEPELKKKIDWISELTYMEFKECIWSNIGMTQLDYMELFNISSPNYTSLSNMKKIFS